MSFPEYLNRLAQGAKEELGRDITIQDVAEPVISALHFELEDWLS